MIRHYDDRLFLIVIIIEIKDILCFEQVEKRLLFLHYMITSNPIYAVFIKNTKKYYSNKLQYFKVLFVFFQYELLLCLSHQFR